MALFKATPVVTSLTAASESAAAATKPKMTLYVSEDCQVRPKTRDRDSSKQRDNDKPMNYFVQLPLYALFVACARATFLCGCPYMH